MPGRLAGQLVDGGDPVADEPVFVVDTGPADESNWSIVATDRSAGDGSWSVTVPNADAERYHAVAQFEGGATLKNALSKPFLTSQPFAQAAVVSVGFDVLSDAVSVGPALQASGLLHRYVASELDADDDEIVTNWPSVESDVEITGSGVYESSAIGNGDAINFANGDDGFQTSDGDWSDDISEGDYTFVAIAESRDLDPDGSGRSYINDNRNGSLITHGFDGAGLYYWDGSDGYQIGNLTASENEPFIAIWSRDASEGVVIGRYNGSEAVESASINDLSGRDNAIAGRANELDTDWFDGYIAEVFWYNRVLSSEEFVNLESYAQSEYSVSL